MSEVAALIEDMVRAGVDPSLIGRAAALLSERSGVDAQAERRRAKDRERKRLRNSAESAESVEQQALPSPMVPFLPLHPNQPPLIPHPALTRRARPNRYPLAKPNPRQGRAKSITRKCSAGCPVSSAQTRLL